MKYKLLVISYVVFVIGLTIFLGGGLANQYYHSQDYNYISYFGLFIFIFALIIIFVYSFISIFNEVDEFSVSTENIICPSCSRSIPFYSIFCPYCRYKFVKDLLTPAELEKNMNELKERLKSYNRPKICFLCGFKLNGNENFCPDCGHRF